jgi:Holliday junction resolvase-like predicted endonuclease
VHLGLWIVGDRNLKRLERARPRFESDLEDWIERDPSLLGDGLKIVGRQVRLDSGPLDLLAIDAQGRWVVIELKREHLRRRVLAQAFDYASSIASMDATQLRRTVEPYLASHPDPELAALVEDTLSSEVEGNREVAVVVAGLRADDQLQRMNDFLASRHGVPISMVILSGFELPDGSLALIREVSEDEGTHSRAPDSEEGGFEGILRRADECNVGPQFRRFLDIVNSSGLFVRPYTRSVMVTPPQHHNRFLIVARPATGGRMRLNHNPDAFVEWFPHLTTDDVVASLGSRGHRRVGGGDLDHELDRLSAFLGTLSQHIADPDGEG